MWLLAALILVPLIEIGLFIEIGGALGLWPTLALILVTAALGAGLMRAQGFAAMMRMRDAMERGEDPRGPLAEGAMILVAGALMLTPGFFTDALGLLFLLPPVRAAAIRWAGPRLAARAAAHRTAHQTARGGPREAPISAEYEVIDEAEPRGESGWTRPPGPRGG